MIDPLTTNNAIYRDSLILSLNSKSITRFQEFFQSLIHGNVFDNSPKKFPTSTGGSNETVRFL